MSIQPLTIALVAGEPSGDILGAGLIRALKKQQPDLNFVGIAGPHMKAEGCEAWFEIEDLAVMGIVEVLKHLPRILMIRRRLRRRLVALKPDVFIGIDAPDFNIPVENYLKQRNIRTIHYVSPSVWAWRQRRIFKIAQATQLVLALLPFEKAFYDRFNVPCRFVGHTLADRIPLNPDKEAARSKLGIPLNVRVLAILPGSRQIEIESLSADFLNTAKILKEKYPELVILVPLVNKEKRQQFELIKAKVQPSLNLHLFEDQASDVMIASDAALVASGTATLECMLAKCPMVVAYRSNALTFWLAKKLMKIKYIALPNLLAGREIVKELIQDDCQPEALERAIEPLLFNQKIRSDLFETFYRLHKEIRCEADMQAAQAVLEVARG